MIHYEGEQGARYFAYQNVAGLDQGRLEARKFARHIQPSNTVVDFGCGSGAVLANLRCARRIGVEVNPAARAEAARHAIELHASPESIPAATADVAISNHALEHVPSPLATLAQLRAILVPGGRLLLCVPIDDWRTQREFRADDPNHHLYTWTPLLLGNLLAEAGFRVGSIRVLTHCWPLGWRWLMDRVPDPVFDTLAWMQSCLLRRRQLFAIASKP